MGHKGGKSPEGSGRYHEVLILQRKDSYQTSIQHNQDMLLDDQDPVADSQSQIDWDGDIWPQHRVLAVVVFSQRKGYYAIGLPPAEGSEEPRAAAIMES